MEKIKMENKKSYERMKAFQKSLMELSNEVEDQYLKMRKECIEEIVLKEEEKIVQKNDMYNLYDKLTENHSLRMIYIRNHLPWYLKLLKVNSTEMKLYGSSLFIGVNLGKSNKTNFFIEVRPVDIGWKN